MPSTKPTIKSTPLPSARADGTTRKRPSVDLSLIDAQLDELFAAPDDSQPDNAPSARADNESKIGSFQLLSHKQINIRPQVRQTFPEEELAELRNSIKGLREKGQGIEGTGILQALLVSYEAEGYRLIAGERRFRASQAEGITLLPCVVIGAVTENSARILQLTENALRTPPPIIEEAHAIKDAMAAEKLSIRDMARVLGKDKSFVESRVNLLKYPTDVQELVSARADTLRHARHLAGVKDDTIRHQLILAVRDEGIGEREVKRRISTTEANQSNTDTQSVDTKIKDSANQNLSNSPAIHSLNKALKASNEFLEIVRTTSLNENEKQKLRESRHSLQAILEELDKLSD